MRPRTTRLQPGAPIGLPSGPHRTGGSGTVTISQDLRRQPVVPVSANPRWVASLAVDAGVCRRPAALIVVVGRVCWSGSGSGSAGPGEVGGPVGFPGLAVVGRERLLPPGRRRCDVRPRVAHRDVAAFVVLLAVEHAHRAG